MMKGISAIVAAIYLVTMLALTVIFVTTVLNIINEQAQEQSRIVHERALSATIANAVIGWWLLSDNTLTINVTSRAPFTIELSSIAILYSNGEYDILSVNLNTIGDRLIDTKVETVEGTITTPSLPIVLGPGESMQIRLRPKYGEVATVTGFVTKPGVTSTTIAFRNYHELVGGLVGVITPLLYNVTLAPITLGEGTVSTIGYSIEPGPELYVSDISVDTGIGEGAIEAFYEDDNVYYNISSSYEERAVYAFSIELSFTTTKQIMKGTLIIKALSNTTGTTLEFYAWDGVSWNHLYSYSFPEANTEEEIEMNISSYYIKDDVVRIKINASYRENPFKISFDQIIMKSYVVSHALIYVGVGGLNKIIVYDPVNGTFLDTIVTPKNVVFSGEQAIAFDPDHEYIWLVAPPKIYYYSLVEGKWVDYTRIRNAGEGVAVHYYNNLLLVIPGKGSETLLIYNLSDTSRTKPFEVDLGYPVGDYSSSCIAGDKLYIVTGGGNNIFISYDIRTDDVNRLEDAPTAYPTGLAYDYDRNYLWLIGRGGGLFYYDITSGHWYPYRYQIPYTPMGQGDRLEYYSGKLYHFRGDNTREIWIISTSLRVHE